MGSKRLDSISDYSRHGFNLRVICQGCGRATVIDALGFSMARSTPHPQHRVILMRFRSGVSLGERSMSDGQGCAVLLLAGAVALVEVFFFHIVPAFSNEIVIYNAFCPSNRVNGECKLND